jgi:hypothetical protein
MKTAETLGKMKKKTLCDATTTARLTRFFEVCAYVLKRHMKICNKRALNIVVFCGRILMQNVMRRGNFNEKIVVIINGVCLIIRAYRVQCR